jgi:hypothetical protein
MFEKQTLESDESHTQGLLGIIKAGAQVGGGFRLVELRGFLIILYIWHILGTSSVTIVTLVQSWRKLLPALEVDLQGLPN